MTRLLPILLVLGLTIYAFIDCLNTEEDKVRHLPKVAWVLIILLFTIVGPVAWLITGRARTAGGWGGTRPATAGPRFVAPDDNPEFLKSLEQRGDDEDGKRD
ncbi:PLD nuclease N-terminal domain-containing protein [Wenjunlia tyrosinilytica]|jgi:hypothetical protein|uniref:Membrane protein n=1 Tax=Wenjunlia tyrosinilytica TaxID=1544741 RepID=A0A917ZRD4_9ACTN|nr:PLD nuclease N-terminal domain-containing protein [Wenjunlia tyrosinilytica]GGO89743.1 membrane protein [Wenjunlia tyrosinilytica]